MNPGERKKPEIRPAGWRTRAAEESLYDTVRDTVRQANPGRDDAWIEAEVRWFLNEDEPW